MVTAGLSETSGTVDCYQCNQMKRGSQLFVEGRGTYMAISLAHDVMAYFNDRGSAVYTCSLDAEGVFDAIPHVAIFRKHEGIVPDYAWLVMYAWYRQMYATIRLHGALG